MKICQQTVPHTHKGIYKKIKNLTYNMEGKTLTDTITAEQLDAIDEEGSRRLAELFKTLGDPTRIKLLRLLVKNAELTVSAIAENLGMGQSAISHQLRVLRGARLVKYHKDGKEAWYSLDDDHVLTLMGQGMEHVLHN